MAAMKDLLIKVVRGRWRLRIMVLVTCVFGILAIYVTNELLTE